MYIKSVVLDGFKSYAQRTEVNGFDPQFNAITGLNGSGKSNILDSICFLMGITNLSCVRAGNLQDLVYKSGQAGVTKATVSIVFDNKDKTQSPFGYDQYDELTITRQIILGGRNKYLINGTNAPNQRVSDLFRSVQLNVNNPHFLIMQGRITKVLNMKPKEILSLLEEAASTRHYETKKENALKTIEKKDSKLNEINRVLEQDITPTLSKLRQERSSYLEYQNVVRALDHLSKFCIAYKFVTYEELKQKTKDDLETMKTDLESMLVSHDEMKTTKSQLEELMAELAHERDKQQGGILQDLEAEFGDCQKEEAVKQGSLQRAKDTVANAEKNRANLVKQHKDSINLKNRKQKELEDITGEFESLRAKAESDEQAHAKAQKHLQDVNSGLVTDEDGVAATLEEQLRMAQQESSAADRERKQADMQYNHLKREVDAKSAELQRTNQSFAREESAKLKYTKDLENIEKQMSQLNYTDGLEDQLDTDYRNARRDYDRLRDTIDQKQARFANLNFEYSDPEPRFNRQRVKGVVAKLFSSCDPKFATALEVTAGGKLYNVVVDTEQTGKLIMERGQLKKRVTLLPLNKMRGNPVPDHVIQKAKHLVGANKVWTALSLINYDPGLSSAMEYVFGNALICTDLDSAKIVAFNEEVKRRTITLEGDVFDPQGTLSGGSRNQNFSVLNELADLKRIENELYNVDTRLHDLQQQLNNARHTAEKSTDLRNRRDQIRYELDLLQQKLQDTDFHRISSFIEKSKAEMDDLKKTIVECNERFKTASNKIATVKRKIENAAEEREREIKAAEVTLAQAKRTMEQSAANLANRQTYYDTIKMEIEELGNEVQTLQTQLEEAQTQIETFKTELQQEEESYREVKDKLNDTKKRLNAQKELIQRHCREVNKKEKEIQDISKKISDSELKIDDIKRKIQLQIKESKDAGSRLAQLIETHPWIPDERAYFGQPDSAYDFQKQDPEEASKRIATLTERKEKLSKTVNMRAMNMLATTEEHYKELMKKKVTVERDKVKIQSIIDELDKRKNDALVKAHEKVDKDFNSIFSTLLPGSKAHLVPADGRNILEGLEFRIAFGDIYKESLNELSGGQRSLVALSLILALLLFKPAPLYILDEVDAALDLSHTQNIGQLIKKHFQHSQFIIVSLKDGMFNNANVLFKTKFVDGVSTVTRHVPQKPAVTNKKR